MKEEYTFHYNSYLEVLTRVIGFAQNEVSVHLADEGLVFIDTQLGKKRFPNLK